MERRPPKNVMSPSPFSGTAEKAGKAGRGRGRQRGICGKLAGKGREIDFHGARTRDGLLLRADHRTAGAGRRGVPLAFRRPVGVGGRSGGNVAGGRAARGGDALAGGRSGGAGNRVRHQFRAGRRRDRAAAAGRAPERAGQRRDRLRRQFPPPAGRPAQGDGRADAAAGAERGGGRAGEERAEDGGRVDRPRARGAWGAYFPAAGEVLSSCSKTGEPRSTLRSSSSFAFWARSPSSLTAALRWSSAPWVSPRRASAQA